MQNLGALLSDFVMWVAGFAPWSVRVRTTHRAVAFRHRFRFRLCPRVVFRLLPCPLAKRVARFVPFVKKKHSWCRPVALRPGIHWYWPKTTEIELLPVERQTLDLPVQSLQTADLKDVSVRAEVIFIVDDVRLAVCKTFDFQQTIQDVAQLTVVRVVAGRTRDELAEGLRDDTVCDELTEKLRVELQPYGVGLLRAFLCEFTRSSTLRVYGEHMPGVISVPDGKVLGP